MSDSGIREIIGDYKPKKRRSLRAVIPYLVTAIIFSLISFSVTFVINKQQRAKEEVLLVIHGGKSVDEAELRRVVSEKKLTVYWVGPEKGFRYVLNAAVTSSISLRYIPEGSSLGDNKVAYREIGTFVSANAFKVTQQAATLENGVGFVNVDGNAVYYDSRDAKNVYIGLKDADIQVEIFDPRPDQSLAEALMQGRVQKIK